jgi:hypothetical protein
MASMTSSSGCPAKWNLLPPVSAILFFLLGCGYGESKHLPQDGSGQVHATASKATKLAGALPGVDDADRLAAVKVAEKNSDGPVAGSEAGEAMPVKEEAAEPDAESARPAPALDLETLTERLKQTDAIGLFTKLAIRNDVMDLADTIKKYRKKSLLTAKLDLLRSRFEGLFLKIVALLEKDPGLSRDIYLARETIWKSLLEVKI